MHLLRVNTSSLDFVPRSERQEAIKASSLQPRPLKNVKYRFLGREILEAPFGSQTSLSIKICTCKFVHSETVNRKSVHLKGVSRKVCQPKDLADLKEVVKFHRVIYFKNIEKLIAGALP
jgi:hypothetical protein